MSGEAAEGASAAESAMAKVEKECERLTKNPPKAEIVRDGGIAGLQSTERAVEAISSEEKIRGLSQEAAHWLGGDVRIIRNASGDTIFLSKDGTKRLRFDINNPAPHTNPHGHVEQLVNGKWEKSGPLYPKDVPHS